MPDVSRKAAEKPEKRTLQQWALACRGKYSGTAVECENRMLSYDAFDAMTEKVAQVLSQKGIGPGMTVILRMPRTERMMAALFAVVRVGAAVLPVPVDFPEMRCRDIYRMSRAALTLTEEGMEAILSEKDGITAFRQDYPLAGPEDPALILFTSGSTGQPKGVVHTQMSAARGVMNLPGEMPGMGLPCREFGTVLGKTSENFISSYALEYFSALLFGRTLVMLTEQERIDYRAIGSRMETHPGSSLFSTATEIENYLREESFRRQFRNLGVLVLSGERITDEVRERILTETDRETTLLSIYGMTECFEITFSNLRDREWQNGTLCPGVEAEILKENRCVSAGESGEIVLRSPMQMAEYLGARERFYSLGGVRWLGTGDIGEKTADGKLIVRGRGDRLVKFHGLRIELDDVQTNVLRFPGIQNAAVVLANTAAGTQIICAYYESLAELNLGDIRAFLADYLPDYMIPARFIRLRQLPRNRSGKINYTELMNRPYQGKTAGGHIRS